MFSKIILVLILSCSIIHCSSEAFDNGNTTSANITEECIEPAYLEFPTDVFTQEERMNGFIFIHITVVCYIFYSLAIVCDDYFIPSLQLCSEKLGLSDDVAGATLMAAGSSATELFTALLSVFVLRGDIGTGTVVGSAVFNVLGTIGLCGLFGTSVKLNWWPVMRDSVWYALSVTVLIVCIFDGTIGAVESFAMISMYVTYIIIMKYDQECQHYIASKLSLSVEDCNIETIPEGSDPNIADPAAETSGEKLHKKVCKRMLSGVLVLITFPINAIFYVTIPSCKKRPHLFLVTFIIAAIWTAVLSYVMVWMITLIGYTVGIPDTVTAITFIAAGSSIPDAYASIQVSRKGQGAMAVANPIGSNIFDILIGLAVPWFLETAIVNPGSTYYVQSVGLAYAIALLFVTLIAAIILIHSVNWILCRRLGCSLLIVYACFLVIAIPLQFNVFGEVNPIVCNI